VEGRNELHAPERELMRPANVHTVRRRAMIRAEFRQLVGRDHDGLVALGERDGVAQVIPVPV
jgi:hypothetical protein